MTSIRILQKKYRNINHTGATDVKYIEMEFASDSKSIYRKLNSLYKIVVRCVDLQATFQKSVSSNKARTDNTYI